MKLHYFAYGSNMHPERLRRRVPSSRLLEVAILTGHVLRFHKRGEDGSAKCNALHTGRDDDSVIGVVYEMDRVEQPLLDKVEGRGYRVRNLRVIGDRHAYNTYAYVAHDGFIDESLKPYHWYKSLVLNGARFHALPHDYVARLLAVESAPDADPSRTEQHLAMLQVGIEGES